MGILKHTGNYSNWVLPDELDGVMRALHASATLRHTSWLGTAMKYVNVRIDMRTGHFVLTDSEGKRFDEDDWALEKLSISGQDQKELDLRPGENTKYFVVINESSLRRLHTHSKHDVHATPLPINVFFADSVNQAHFGRVPSKEKIDERTAATRA